MSGYSPPAIHAPGTLVTIGALDTLSTGVRGWANAASVAWPLANVAIYVPFSVSASCTAFEGWAQAGGTAGGNYDIGIYSAAGARLVSAGATTRTLSALNNTTAMGDQVLLPGVRYYMAMSADGTNNWIALSHAAGLCEASGILESTSSYVLPSGPSISRTTRAYVPNFGLNLYTVSL